MKVLNYYAMPLKELYKRINIIRRLLLDGLPDEKREKAWFALDVACRARDLYEVGVNKSEQTMIDIICYS